MSDTVFSLQGVSKTWGQVHALRDVSLELREGQVLGLLGHNGAGKSTAMKLILGLIRPSSGVLKVFGHDPSGVEASLMRLKLGYLPENVSFYEQLSGEEVLTYFARLKGVERRQVQTLLERVGLAHAAKRRVGTYSKGMRQRLGLAQALIGEPRLLLLDEPTVGLDPMATRDFYGMIDELRARGVSVVLCSHVLPGVERHIDRAAILGQGRLLASGSIDELRDMAGLPLIVRGRIDGARDALERRLSDSGVALTRLNGNAFELAAPAGGKLAVLRNLLQSPELTDIELDPPNLETLYAHFDGQIRTQETLQ